MCVGVLVQHLSNGKTLFFWDVYIVYEIILPSYVVIISSTIPKTLVENNHIKCQDSMELCLDNTKTIVRHFPGSNPFRKGYLRIVLNSCRDTTKTIAKGFLPIGSMGLVYLPTFTIQIKHTIHGWCGLLSYYTRQDVVSMEFVEPALNALVSGASPRVFATTRAKPRQLGVLVVVEGHKWIRGLEYVPTKLDPTLKKGKSSSNIPWVGIC